METPPITTPPVNNTQGVDNQPSSKNSNDDSLLRAYLIKSTNDAIKQNQESIERANQENKKLWADS